MLSRLPVLVGEQRESAVIGKAAALTVAALLGSFILLPVAIAKSDTELCKPAPVGGDLSLDAEQQSNLAVIIGVGHRLGAGSNGQVIGVMTALTESTLRNVDHGDAAGPDSRGLFQQRAGWGPLEVRMNPEGASKLFFEALLDLPGWAAMQPWAAAQAVQRSAFANGDNYRRNYELATRLTRQQPGACTAWQLNDSDELPGAQIAVAKAMTMIGQTGYYQLCARLAANIWGRDRAGYVSAAEQWNAMVDTAQAHQGDRRPPLGALVFWSTSGPYGHVAVYVGAGRIVSNDIGDTVPGIGGVYLTEIGSIESRWNAKYLGWAPPIYPDA
ncbi:CHAP domain-containing protein [Kribbella qitaiheensis]|uniref:CHAP domain-containing protein n=1 Tax=Kribbella qitaiheensis TaxID=1544730 RepID=UPI0036222C0A